MQQVRCTGGGKVNGSRLCSQKSSVTYEWRHTTIVSNCSADCGFGSLTLIVRWLSVIFGLIGWNQLEHLHCLGHLNYFKRMQALDLFHYWQKTAGVNDFLQLNHWTDWGQISQRVAVRAEPPPPQIVNFCDFFGPAVITILVCFYCVLFFSVF